MAARPQRRPEQGLRPGKEMAKISGGASRCRPVRVTWSTRLFQPGALYLPNKSCRSCEEWLRFPRSRRISTQPCESKPSPSFFAPASLSRLPNTHGWLVTAIFGDGDDHVGECNFAAVESAPRFLPKTFRLVMWPKPTLLHCGRAAQAPILQLAAGWRAKLWQLWPSPWRLVPGNSTLHHADSRLHSRPRTSSPHPLLLPPWRPRRQRKPQAMP